MQVGILVAVATLVVASVAGLALRRRDGRFQPVADTTERDLLASLGVAPGPDVTLLQFSTVFCGPCRTTRALCVDVARTVPGVRHLEVDADSHLDAVRALDIWRTPTVLVLDRDGAIVARAAGAPTRAQLIGVVGAALPRAVA